MLDYNVSNLKSKFPKNFIALKNKDKYLYVAKDINQLNENFVSSKIVKSMEKKQIESINKYNKKMTDLVQKGN